MPHNAKGFTLIEMVTVVIVLSLVLLATIKMYEPAMRQTGVNLEIQRLTFTLDEKAQELTALGFWVWDVDTQNPRFPGNPNDPAEIWITQLTANNLSTRATIDTVFLKDSGGTLVPFSGPEFDGNLPRDKVEVTLSIYSSKGVPFSQTVTFFQYPGQQKVYAQMFIIRTALQQYYVETGVYPPSNNLEALVPNYLVEIPNDPYTAEKEKITHTEEFSDWYYDHTGTTLRLAPNSNRSWEMTWTY